METVEATLLGAIIIIALSLIIGMVLIFIGSLLACLLMLIPNTISDKIDAILSNIVYVFCGIIFIIVIGSACYQVGIGILK